MTVYSDMQYPANDNHLCKVSSPRISADKQTTMRSLEQTKCHMSESDRQTHNFAKCFSAECLQMWLWWHQSQCKQTLAPFPFSHAPCHGVMPKTTIKVCFSMLESVKWLAPQSRPHCSCVVLSLTQVTFTTDLSSAQEVIKQSTTPSLSHTLSNIHKHSSIWFSCKAMALLGSCQKK